MPDFGLIAWALKNLKWILLGVGIIAYSIFMYHAGQKDIQADWDAAETAKNKIIIAERDKMQAKLDQVSGLYQKAKDKRAKDLTDIKRRYNDEVSRNAIYTQCFVTDNFVSLYEAASGVSSAKSGSVGQP